MIAAGSITQNRYAVIIIPLDFCVFLCIIKIRKQVSPIETER